MSVIKNFVQEPSDLVKFRMVLNRLSRIIILFNCGTLIHIQDDTRDPLLQRFTSGRILMADLDGSICCHRHDPSQETRLNPELSPPTCCVSIQYTCKVLSPIFSISPEVNSSNSTTAKLLVNNNCPAVLTKVFAIEG